MDVVVTELAHILVDLSIEDPVGRELWGNLIDQEPTIVGYTLSQNHYVTGTNSPLAKHSLPRVLEAIQKDR